MSLLATFLYFAAVISGYAAAMALLLCPWLAKGLRRRLPRIRSILFHGSGFTLSRHPLC